jgi:hypothetical protein
VYPAMSAGAVIISTGSTLFFWRVNVMARLLQRSMTIVRVDHAPDAAMQSIDDQMVAHSGQRDHPPRSAGAGGGVGD